MEPAEYGPLLTAADDGQVAQPRSITFPRRVAQDTWTALSHNYINVLLVFVPIGIIPRELGLRDTTTLIVEVLAIMALGTLLSFSARSLTLRHEQSSRGLVHTAARNLVDTIVLLVALVQGQVRVVQSGILGAMLANMLLMLGSCFIASGIRREESHFNETVASMTSALLAIAAAYMAIPTALGVAIGPGYFDYISSILIFSHAVSVIMLTLYGLYLYFRLRSHARLFNIASRNEIEAVDEPQHLSRSAALILMAVVAFYIVVCATHLIHSIDAVVSERSFSKTFMGLILLPLLGIPEHVTTCAVAYQDSTGLAVDVAVGGCIQLVLFITPLLVLTGWIMGVPMTLDFGSYDAIAFFFSVLVVNYIIQDGKSNYLEGCVLLVTWLIIAVAFYIYPLDRVDNLLLLVQ